MERTRIPTTGTITVKATAKKDLQIRQPKKKRWLKGFANYGTIGVVSSDVRGAYGANPLSRFKSGCLLRRKVQKCILRLFCQEKETEERNLQFIRDDATIKANSGLPAKINNPDTRIAHTVDVDLPKIKGVVPKMSEATEVYTMAGGQKSPGRYMQNIIIMSCIGMKMRKAYRKQRLR